MGKGNINVLVRSDIRNAVVRRFTNWPPYVCVCVCVCVCMYVCMYVCLLYITISIIFHIRWGCLTLTGAFNDIYIHLVLCYQFRIISVRRYSYYQLILPFITIILHVPAKTMMYDHEYQSVVVLGCSSGFILSQNPPLLINKSGWPKPVNMLMYGCGIKW